MANAGEQKKPRSPVERAVVWGGISILLIIGGIQGMAAYGFTVSKDKIIAAVKRSDESSDELNLNEAEELMSGFWSKEPIREKNHERYVVYSWTGVYQNYRVLLNLGADESNPIVMGYELNSETSNHAETIAGIQKPSAGETADGGDETSAAPSMMGMSGGGPGGAGPGGSGGGRPRIDWDELDKDGDGKWSKEEVPEFLQERFDSIDTNEDGLIDEKEREAMRALFTARRNSGGGRGPAGGGGRPQRPTNDDDPPAKLSPDDEPAPPAKPEEAASPEAAKE